MQEKDIMAKAKEARIKLGIQNQCFSNLSERVMFVEKLSLVYHPISKNISSICIKQGEEKGIIALNSAMTLGKQNFALAHALYHFFYDEMGTYICNASFDVTSEEAANAFAGYFILPEDTVRTFVETILKRKEGKLSIKDVIRIEQYFGVNHTAAMYQLSKYGYISNEDLECWSEEILIQEAENMGFRMDLYRPLPEEKQYGTYGHYIRQARKLYEQEQISNGQYEQLLTDAFREDMVYGIGEPTIID
jgi:Zn-dependent peptidase ImmA (M78 family)